MASPILSLSALKETVLKIQINDSVRRIPVDRIIEDGNFTETQKENNEFTALSYTKLLNYVKDYIRETGADDIQITYVDEEKEEIIVSTDLELLEAIMTLHKLPQYDDDDDESFEPHNSMKTPPVKYVLRMRASLRNEKPFISFPPIFDKMGQIPARYDSSTKLPAGVVAIDAFFTLVARVLDNFQKAQNSRDMKEDSYRRDTVIPPVSATKGRDYTSFDPTFVHGRHSCDDCGVDPIVGYRYHSSKKANYDLCHECFCKNFEQKNTDEDMSSFGLAQHEPDRVFKRQKVNHGWPIAGVYNYLRPKKQKRKKKLSHEEEKEATDSNLCDDDLEMLNYINVNDFRQNLDTNDIENGEEEISFESNLGNQTGDEQYEKLNESSIFVNAKESTAEEIVFENEIERAECDEDLDQIKVIIEGDLPAINNPHVSSYQEGDKSNEGSLIEPYLVNEDESIVKVLDCTDISDDGCKVTNEDCSLDISISNLDEVNGDSSDDETYLEVCGNDMDSNKANALHDGSDWDIIYASDDEFVMANKEIA